MGDADEIFGEVKGEENIFGDEEASSQQDAQVSVEDETEVQKPTPQPPSTPVPSASSSAKARNTSFAEVMISRQTEAFPSLFEITVSDPEKKGDGMNAFVSYNVITKTTSPDYVNPSMNTGRRFNNFVWLYEQLTTKYPGVIVPPIPEKQALGRFETGFLDQRRFALEKCLQRIGSHPILSKSPDFKLFLESKDLEGDIKKKEPKKSLFSSLTSSMSDVVNTATQTFSKLPEADEFFETKRSQLETLETHLRSLLKTIEVFAKQRRDLATANREFGESSTSLGNSEFNKPLGASLVHLGDLQKKIEEILTQQANADAQYIEFTVEEYLRIISSAKVAMEARIKAYSAWKSADSALLKKKEQLAKLAQQPNKSAKAIAMEKEVEESEKAVEKAKEGFEEITELLRKELQRFDKEKVEDFQVGLTSFVESMIENQKKIIALWEGYLPEVQAL